MSLRANYLQPEAIGSIGEIATVLRIGKAVAIADIDVVDAEAKLATAGRSGYATALG